MHLQFQINLFSSHHQSPPYLVSHTSFHSQKSEISNATLENMSTQVSGLRVKRFAFNLFQVELLHKQLVSLRLEEVLSAPLVHSLADPQVELRESFRLDFKAREMF